MAEPGESRLFPRPPGVEICLTEPDWQVLSGLLRALENATLGIEVKSSFPKKRAIFVHSEDEPSYFQFVLMGTDEEGSLHKIYEVHRQHDGAVVDVKTALRAEDYTEELGDEILAYEAGVGLTVPNEEELSDLRVTINDVAEGILTGQVTDPTRGFDG